MALAYSAAGNHMKAIDNINQLISQHPTKLAFALSKAEILRAAHQYGEALNVLNQALQVTPQNYPLTMTQAEILMQTGQPGLAAAKLKALTLLRPNDVNIWYLLAEAEGLANNIVGVHEARAEYFVLIGNFGQALKQLRFAKPMVRNNFQMSAKISERMKEISRMVDQRNT